MNDIRLAQVIFDRVVLIRALRCDKNCKWRTYEGRG